MDYPKTLEIDATYQCDHTLHLTKTARNEDEKENFIFWMYGYELCPTCKEQNNLRYRGVYDAIENPRNHNYIILFKRRSPVWTGSMLFEENLWSNSDTNLRTTRFLVENDINHHGHMPVGLYKEDHFVPFSGYTAEYMKFLLRHDLQAVQAENGLRNTRVSYDWGV